MPSTSLSRRAHIRTTKFRLAHNVELEVDDPLDARRHDVAMVEFPHALGRAREQQVPLLQRDVARHVFDQLRHRPDHILRRPRLSSLAVDVEVEIDVRHASVLVQGNRVSGDQRGVGEKGVTAFGDRPRAAHFLCLRLPVASGEIDGADVSEDVLVRELPGHIGGALADDDAQLDFVVNCGELGEQSGA